MRKSTGVIVFFCISLFSAPSDAQNRRVTSHTLDITLNNVPCERVTSEFIYVIIQGDDRNPIQASRPKPVERCHWSIVNSPRAFHDDDLYTLHLRGARSDCTRGKSGTDGVSPSEII